MNDPLNLRVAIILIIILESVHDLLSFLGTLGYHFQISFEVYFPWLAKIVNQEVGFGRRCFQVLIWRQISLNLWHYHFSLVYLLPTTVSD